MAPFKKMSPDRSPVISTTSTPSKPGRFSTSDDPFLALMQPSADETDVERRDRISREAREKQISDEIDRALEQEIKDRKKKHKDGASEPKEILLLGPTGSGKTTFTKQLRLSYDLKGLDAERETNRYVILLNLSHSVRLLLSLLENDTTSPAAAAQAQASSIENLENRDPFRPLSPIGREANGTTAPRNQSEATYRRRVRLAPLLGLESQLRETLGEIASGASAASIAAHISDSATTNLEGVQKLGWRDAAQVTGHDGYSSQPQSNRASVNLESLGIEGVGKHSVATRRREVRSRASSPGGFDDEPLFAPGYATKPRASLTVGNGKESRRAKAQGSPLMQSSSMNSDGSFLAAADDPIHLLSALKDEVTALWKECCERGLIAGEGPKSESLGGFELSESSKYFLNSLNRIAQPTWLPSDSDLLNVRVRTLGIETHHLQITPAQSYKICDVAGARGVKHSWAPYFDSAAAIIFIAAVSDYNVCNPQDPRLNRVLDALDLFEDIATNPILKKVVLITFMNKVDSLRRKVKSGLYPVKKFFPTYEGGVKSAEILSYFQALFERRHSSRNRALYIFATQANDTKSTTLVVASLNDILMRSTLAASGLL